MIRRSRRRKGVAEMQVKSDTTRRGIVGRASSCFFRIQPLTIASRKLFHQRVVVAGDDQAVLDVFLFLFKECPGSACEQPVPHCALTRPDHLQTQLVLETLPPFWLILYWTTLLWTTKSSVMVHCRRYDALDSIGILLLFPGIVGTSGPAGGPGLRTSSPSAAGRAKIGPLDSC